jgi:hypothetical protein
MWQGLLKNREKIWYIFLTDTITLAYASMLCFGPFSQVVSAHTVKQGHTSVATDNCRLQAIPDSHSVLLVLLDRSGSLVASDGYATDPSRYSTSITKALADLWPGILIVIPFGDPHLNGAYPNVPVLPVYRATLSDSTQRETLKNNVENYPIIGGTPLAPAMKIALDPVMVPELQNPVPGSRAIIITDGEPTPATESQYLNETTDRQVQEITSKPGYISQFRDRCIPINPFGLKTDAPADSFLSQIATGTGGEYTHVQSAQELAQKVIQLYNNWLGLSLSQATKDTDGNYPVFINDFASHAYIIAFRSDASYNVNLFGSDGKTPVTGISPGSIDTHYEIYTLNTLLVPVGIYKVNMSNDSGAQVYGLADFQQLHLNLLAPNPMNAYINQPLTIKAALLKGQEQYIPTGLAELSVDVTYSAGGKTSTILHKDLKQYDKQGTFSYQLPTYTQLGQLRIQIHVIYQEIPNYSQAYMLSLLYFCNKGQLQCFWEQYELQTIPAVVFLTIIVLLLIAWYIWSKQPKLEGTLTSIPEHGSEEVAVSLFRDRKWLVQLLRRSIISSNEILAIPRKGILFDFDVAQFEFVAHRLKSTNGQKSADDQITGGGQNTTYIKQAPGNMATIIIKRGNKEIPVANKDFSQSVLLQADDTINIENRDKAWYSLN